MRFQGLSILLNFSFCDFCYPGGYKKSPYDRGFQNYCIRNYGAAGAGAGAGGRTEYLISDLTFVLGLRVFIKQMD